MAAPETSYKKPIDSRDVLYAQGISHLGQTVSHESDSEDLSDTLEEYETIFEDAGTLCKVKVLYEGTPKCKCCINWVDEEPVDLKEAIEEQTENKRHAILVRMKKNHGEGKPLILDSIVLQNTHLKKLLGEVFQGYDGITTTLKKLVFKPPFHAFYYAWDDFSRLCRTQSDIVVRNYAKLLRKVLKAELAETLSVSTDLARNGVVTFDYLWTIFKPGIDVYTLDKGNDRIYKLKSSTYQNICGRCFTLTVQYVDYDGVIFGWGLTSLAVWEYSGTKPVTELKVFPASLHPQIEEIKQRLSIRGEKFRDLQLEPYHYAAYRGLATDVQDNTFNIDGRIVIDCSAHNFFNPGKRPHLTYIDSSSQGVTIETVRDTHYHSDYDSHSGSKPRPRRTSRRRDYRNHDDQEEEIVIRSSNPPPHPMPMPPQFAPMPDGPPLAVPSHGTPLGFSHAPPGPAGHPGFPGQFPPRPALPNSKDEKQAKRLQLGDKFLHLCNLKVRGYCLKTKKWATFDIDSVLEIRWNEDAFGSLVLAEDYKRLILAFVESQVQNKDSFDDVIEGKGRGIIMLLEGSPGVGKTLTAEAVAEKLHRPLYAISGGELGESAQQLEGALRTILEIAAKWDAVLLLDECDVFLEKRSIDNLRRNGTVAIFLRLLEYYRGVLFMTTNRVNSIDPAFQSRIHLTIEYPNLTAEAREQIWKHFLDNFCPDADFGAANIAELARVELNGREIKNLVKTAQLLAKHGNETLSIEHIRTVLRVIKRNAIAGSA